VLIPRRILRTNWCEALKERKGEKRKLENRESTGIVYDCKVKVVFVRDHCNMGHKVGDEWIVGRTTPAGICTMAYNAIYPNIRLLQRGGHYRFPAGSDVIRSGCTDAWNTVVFETSVVPGSGVTPRPLPRASGSLEQLK